MPLSSARILSFAGLVSCLGWSCTGACQPGGDRPSVSARLSAIQHGWRFTEGRLAGFTYAPYDKVVTLRPWVSREMVRQGLTRELRSLAGRAGAVQLADRALIELFIGRFDAAVSHLEAATASAPLAAAIWNELAVAHLARGHAPAGFYDLVLALEACENSLAADPAFLAARFNRALIAERLELSTTATLAWNDYLARDSTSPWALEATRHLAALLTARAYTLRACDRRNFEEAISTGDLAATDAPTRACPQGARRYAEEELLAAWADDEAAGRERPADLRLRLARHIDDLLRRDSDDRMLADSIAAAQVASTRLHSSLRCLEAGLISYREGLGALYKRRPRVAAQALATAEVELLRARNPFWRWAAFQHAVSSYYLGHYQAARQELLWLGGRLPQDRYSILQGRSAWILGLIRIFEANPAEALVHYQHGLLSCKRGADTECVAALHSLTAESLSFIGDDRPAWEHRRTALVAAANLGDSMHLQTIYDEPAEAALRRGAPRAARLFQDEALAVARRIGDPLKVFDALLRLIPIDRRLEDWSAVDADRTSAESCLRRLSDPGLRRRVEGDLWATYGDALAASRPAAATGAYSRAIEIDSGLGYRFSLVPLLAARALAWERCGDFARAFADFKAGLREVDRRRGALPREQRLHFLEQSRGLFDAMITLAGHRLHDPARAFQYAELGRSRSLLDASPSRSPSPVADPTARAHAFARPISLADLSQGLPPGHVVLEFAMLDDRLLRWVVRREGAAFSEVGIGAGALGNRVKELIAVLEQQAAQAPAKASAKARELYRLLIPASVLGSEGIRRLIIVPDRELNALPFGALVDPVSGSFLIEQAEIIVTPSASFYLSGSTRGKPAPGRPYSALVVGDPMLAAELPPGLAPLPGARREAQHVAALYPRARLMCGAAATKRAFLAAAGSFEVIHLALHAAAAGDNPLLFFATSPSDTGVLAGPEIEKLVLPRTRLVVLAACRSGTGEILETEGPRSAAGAFLAAGVPAVVASLFNLDDLEVERLVRGLHERISLGLDPPAALRAAQLQALADQAVVLSPHRFGWASLELIAVAAPVPRR